MQLKKRILFFFKTITQYKKLFYIGLFIKLILGTFLASNYLTQLFVPFLKYAASTDFFGVYNYFNATGKASAFPYPSIMLVILSIPKFLFSFFTDNDVNAISFVDLFSIRLALLLADMVILYVLLIWLKPYRKKVMLLYWLSPILIYINFIHGQLDVLPVALLIVSLYYLFKHKFFSACIYIALAIGCKTSIILALPFILMYAFKNSAILKNNFYKGVSILIILLLVFNSPVFFSEGYWTMVFQNEEQSKLFATYFTISNSSLFLIVPAIYLLLVMRFWGYWQMSRNLLLMYLGFSFGLITVFIAANQGWYYWSLPFFIYFLVKENKYARLPFLFINIFYFLHFALTVNTDYLQIFQLISPNVAAAKNLHHLLEEKGCNASVVNNVFSTLLQASIIGFCYFMYKYGISQIQHYKMLYQPYLIGISGDSASGKTSLANLLQELFLPSNAIVVNGDDMHKWERGNDNYKTYTHLNPKANNLHLNMMHFLELLKGNKIKRKKYNHQTGEFNESNNIDGSKIIIFEGLHTYYLEYQKNLFDLKVYMHPNENLRKKWKLDRDAKERGHSMEDVLLSIENRKPDAEAYVLQQIKDAEVIISFQEMTEVSNAVEFICLNHFYMDDLVCRLEEKNILISHEYSNNMQTICCKTIINKEAIQELANEFTDELEELGFGEVAWKENVEGLLQLLLVKVIFYKMRLTNILQKESF